MSSQSHKPFESEIFIFLSSRVKFPVFRVESESSHDLVESSQSRVTRTIESLRVIGVQNRVSVQSHEISHFSGHFYAMQWRSMCYKMENKIEICAQCSFNKFDCRLFISKFSQLAF